MTEPSGGDQWPNVNKQIREELEKKIADMATERCTDIARGEDSKLSQSRAALHTAEEYLIEAAANYHAVMQLVWQVAAKTNLNIRIDYFAQKHDLTTRGFSTALLGVKAAKFALEDE